MVMQNVTYTWTKAFTAFYVILGLWLYLAACRKNDRLRMTAAFLALAMGILVHYLRRAVRLVPGAALSLPSVSKTRRIRWKEIATIAATSGAAAAGDVGSQLVDGYLRNALDLGLPIPRHFQPESHYQGNNPVRIAANVFDSIVPAVAL